MSAVLLLTGLLLGFFVGVGATIIWAACSTACNQARTVGQLPPEIEAALHRLDYAAEQVRALMLDTLRGQK